MTSIQNGNEILPNWKLNFDEVSNNVYKVILIERLGRQVATTDQDLYTAIRTCENQVFEMERQISKDWRRFLFDYAMIKLQDKITFSNGDPKNVYGSWYVSIISKMISYIGKDNILIAIDDNSDKVVCKAIAIDELSFDLFMEYIEFLNQAE